MRDRFDKNAKITDMRVAVQLLKDGEEELFLKQHPMPKKCKKMNIIFIKLIYIISLKNLFVPIFVIISEFL